MLEALLEMVFGSILQFICEVVFYLIVEVLLESVMALFCNFIYQAAADLFRITRKGLRVLKVPGWILLGYLSGTLSLLVIPKLIITQPIWQIADVLIAPALVASLASKIEKRFETAADANAAERWYRYFVFVLLFNLVRWLGGT